MRFNLGPNIIILKLDARWDMPSAAERGHSIDTTLLSCRRDVFEDAFRVMHAIPSGVSALPPMPSSGHWSALHSWVMPTPSFLEFIMFSRYMFFPLLPLHSFKCSNFSSLFFFFFFFLLPFSLGRMFLDSLDSLNSNHSMPDSCPLGSSKLEVEFFFFLCFQV